MPLVLTRLMLLLVGWFAQYFPTNTAYPLKEAMRRGWQFIPWRWLDVWGRWDAGWYLSIARHGYVVKGNLEQTQNNIAFFPVYPYLVRWIALPFAHDMPSRPFLLAIGVALSNAFLLAALVVLYQLTLALLDDRPAARRTVLYLLIFPTSFILSSAYSESAFLFLSAAALYAAVKRNWFWAGLLGALAALTRSLGVLILVPLVWLYLDTVEWKLRRVRWSMLWLALVPAAFLAHSYHIYTLTGDPLAVLHVQQAWTKTLATPWATIANPIHTNLFLNPIEQGMTVAFILLSLAALRVLPSAAFGVYSLLLILPPLFSGTLISTPRYYLVVFPAFIVLAMLGRRHTLHQVLSLLFYTLLILFFAAWARFYWIA